MINVIPKMIVFNISSKRSNDESTKALEKRILGFQ